jgi:Predicted transporter component
MSAARSRYGLAALAGAAAGAGLVLSGLSDADHVRRLLDLDRTDSLRSVAVLGFVTVAGVLVAMVGIRVAQRLGRPLLSGLFRPPRHSRLDARLVVGALVLGIGWGLSGLLPGPVLATLLVSPVEAAVLLLAMSLGMRAADVVLTPRQRPGSTDRVAGGPLDGRLDGAARPPAPADRRPG